MEFYYYLKENNNKFDEIFNSIYYDIKKDINGDIYCIIELYFLIKNNYLLSSKKIKEMLKNILFKYVTITKKTIFIEKDKQSKKFKYYVNNNNNNKKQEKKISKITEKFIHYYLLNNNDIH